MRKLTAIILSAALLLGCFAFAVSAQEPAVTRVVTTFCGPGAQGFHWYTAAQAESKVIVNGQVHIGSSKKFQGAFAHSVVAEGLSPGITYTYQIGNYEGSFRTDPGRGAPVSFNLGGDTQATGRDGFRLAANIFGAAFDNYPDAGFYSILGDLTQNCTNEEWDLFFEEFASVNAAAPLIPVSGNHDMYPFWFRNLFTLPGRRNYFNFSGLYYSFDYGDAHIAVLNTNDWFFYVGTAQYHWLINDMNASDARWKIVLTHRPVYTGSDPENAPDILALRRTLAPLCGMLGVDLVLSGHRHSYYRSKPGGGDGAGAYDDAFYTDPEGTVYIIAGAAGGRGGSSPTFANIAIDGDTLTYRAEIYDSETGDTRLRDEFSIEKTLPARPVNPTFKLPESPILNFPGQLLHFFGSFAIVLFLDYIGNILPRMITGLFQ